MTVATEYAPAELAWTGVETSFAPGWSANSVGDVSVVFRQPLGTETLLTQGVQYSVALGLNNAVSIQPLSLPAAPGTLVIRRFTPDTQPTDFENLASYDASVHETLHDNSAMRDGEIRWAEEQDAEAIAALAGLLGSLPGAGSDEIVLYASQAAAALVTINPTKGQVLVARGDALDRPLESPAILERVNDPPIVGFTDATGHYFAYRRKKIELQLCKTVEGDHAKNTLAFERARNHCLDFGGGVIVLPPYDIEVEAQQVLSGGFMSVLGKGKISRLVNRSAGPLFQFGTDTARNLRTDPEDRTEHYGLLNCWLALSASVTAASQAAWKAVNLRHLLVQDVYVKGPVLAIWGTNGTFPGDGLGIENDVHRARMFNVHFDQTTATAGHAMEFHSGSDFWADATFLNGLNATDKAALYLQCVNSGWDGVSLGHTFKGSQWDYGIDWFGKGGGNLTIAANSALFDRCKQVGIRITMIGSNGIFRRMIVDKGVHYAGQLGTTDFQNTGVVLEVRTSGLITGVMIGGVWHDWGKQVVYARRNGAGAGTITDIDVDIEAIDCGRYNGGGVEALVDLDNCETASVRVNAQTQSGVNAYKHAVKLGTEVGKFTAVGVTSKSHSAERIKLPAGVLQVGWWPDAEDAPANRPAYIAAKWYPCGLGRVTNGAAVTADTVFLYPFQITRPLTISDLAARVNTVHAANNFQLAIYANNPATGRPTGAVIGRTSNISTAAAAVVSGAITGGNKILAPGMYWAAFNSSSSVAAFNSRAIDSGDGPHHVGTATLANIFGASGNGNFYLTTPMTFNTWGDMTGAAFTENVATSTMPAVAMKAA